MFRNVGVRKAVVELHGRLCFIDEAADELLIVTSTGETIFAADLRIRLAWINFRTMHFCQHARHEQPHSGAIAGAIDNRNDARGKLLIVNKGMAKITLGALQRSLKQWRTVLHVCACRCV
jgi:hypothetical protein